MSVTSLSCLPYALERWTQGSDRSHGQSKHVSALPLPALGPWYSYIYLPWLSTEVEIPELHHGWCKCHLRTKTPPSGVFLSGKIFPETKISYTDLYYLIFTCHITVIYLKYINYLRRFASSYTGLRIFSSLLPRGF